VRLEEEEGNGLAGFDPWRFYPDVMNMG